MSPSHKVTRTKECNHKMIENSGQRIEYSHKFTVLASYDSHKFRLTSACHTVIKNMYDYCMTTV